MEGLCRLLWMVASIIEAELAPEAWMVVVSSGHGPDLHVAAELGHNSWERLGRHCTQLLHSSEPAVLQSKIARQRQPTL